MPKTKQSKAELEFDGKLELAKKFMEPLIVKYVKKISKLLTARKWTCEEIGEDGDTDYTWHLYAVSPDKIQHHFLIRMMDAREWDGELGTSFRVEADCRHIDAADDVEWDQYLECCLHNYTSRVWVDPGNIRAVETRFRETCYEHATPEVVVEMMEKQTGVPS